MPCAGSTCAGRGRRSASPSTSTPRTRPATGSTPSGGWPTSRGAPAPSGCGASATAGSRRSRSRASGRRRLKAIVPVMATDDRYLDDVHYRGGCVTVSELSQYAVSQVAMNAMPPEAAFRGAAWRADWLRPPGGDPAVAVRLAPPPDRRAVLAAGVARARLRRDQAAIFNIGGWHDSYVDPGVPDAGALPGAVAHARRAVAPLLAARRGARPEPRRAPRDRPLLRPSPARHRQRLGRRAAGRLVRARLRGAEAVPARAARPLAGRHGVSAPGDDDARRWAFGAGSLGRDAGRRRRRLPAPPDDRHPWRAVVGRRRGARTGLPATCVATRTPARRTRPPRSIDALEVLGVPEVVVHLAVDAPIATLSVRLSDVAPDGSVALVSAGVLNLTHRRSHADARAARAQASSRRSVCRCGPPATAGPPGIASGSRWRPQLWPVLWPSPLPGDLQRPSRRRPRRHALELPVIPAAGRSRRCPGARLPDRATGPRAGRIPSPLDGAGPAAADAPVWRIDEDVIAGSTTVHVHDGGEADRPGRPPAVRRRDAADDGLGRRPCPRRARRRRRLSLAGARGRSTGRRADRASRSAPTRSRRRRATDFDLAVRLEVDVDGERFFERDWHEVIPRHLV